MSYLSQDPKGNLLRQWLDVDGVLGVVSKKFRLSGNPPLGTWTIIATVNVSALRLTQEPARVQNLTFTEDRVLYADKDAVWRLILLKIHNSVIHNLVD